jgi:phosphopantothenoylcysteine decarboxylase/phosphopantothenate--cysteine ligase
MLSCLVLATRAPVIVAPAMHTNMYENPVTCHNCHLLRERGFVLVGPGEGRLASGDYGKGRLADIDTIVGTVKHVVACGGDLVGKKIVITCGGTREPLDPVRFIGNRSSGKTGYALAVAARDRGAAVTLITTVEAPGETVGIELVRVETAAQMLAAVNGNVEDIDCLIMAAAVADYRPALFSSDKIKKGSGELTLKLSPTADILSQIEGNFLRIGFAAETGNLEANAREKLGSKKLDLIIANDVNQPEGGFGSDYNQVKLIFKGGMNKDLPLMAKKTMAHEILDEIITLGI